MDRALLERFVAAIAGGEISELVSVLDDHVELLSDGGGKVQAASGPLRGARAVSRFLNGLAARADDTMTARYAQLNGSWGVLIYRLEVLDSVLTVAARDGRLSQVFVPRNSDKLATLANLGNL